MLGAKTMCLGVTKLMPLLYKIKLGVGGNGIDFDFFQYHSESGPILDAESKNDIHFEL